MVFSSLVFICAFFPLTMIAYYLCRDLKSKNICLLIFSLVFYTWGEPKYVLLLAAMSFFDWLFALGIQHTDPSRTGIRKLWVAFACIVNLGLIGLFKYSGMICSTIGRIPAFVENITLPLGISFYTFQLLSYVVDVYRGDAKAEKEYWHVLLYAALFHQCIAGPIVRYNTIAEELFVARDDKGDLADGCVRFTVGLAKKTLLANAFGELADSLLLTDSAIASTALVQTNLEYLSSAPVLALWLGVFAYALQIYFDFSAYSDMAIGMGKMCGLHYCENFDYPYISGSATEFWRRWHMSLGTFFRDYVYIPLGGNRHGALRTGFNLFVVWALTGLWHGASWNFVLWGLYFFVLLLLEKLFLLKVFKKGGALRIVSHLYFVFIILIGWPIFKYTDIRLLKVTLCGMFGLNGNALTSFTANILLQNNIYLLLFGILAVTPLFKTILGSLKKGMSGIWIGRSFAQLIEYVVLPICLLLLSVSSLVGDSYNPFLYFRF